MKYLGERKKWPILQPNSSKVLSLVPFSPERSLPFYLPFLFFFFNFLDHFLFVPGSQNILQPGSEYPTKRLQIAWQGASSHEDRSSFIILLKDCLSFQRPHR